MDIVDLYRRSLVEFTSRVQKVQPHQWSGPTPCAEWDVGALVNHVVGEDRWTVPLFGGATIAEVGAAFEGDLLGTEPVGNAIEAAEQATAVVSEPGALQRTVHLSFGDTPAEEYVWQLLADHLVHAWDLTVAIGAEPRLDPDVVSACATWFAAREELYRQAGVISDRTAVPDSADDQDRLLSSFGRDPRWTRTG